MSTTVKNLKAILKFIKPKIFNKFQQVAFVVLLGTAVNNNIPLTGIIGLLLFFLGYTCTYFYNDLMDMEEDKRLTNYTTKILATGEISRETFISLAINLSFISVFLLTLWDPILGLLAVSAVLLNNLRTHQRCLTIRQLMLVAVELLNFEAFWQALYGTFIPGMFIPVFIVYSGLYAFLHMIFKNILKNSDSPMYVAVKKSVFSVTGIILLSISGLGVVFSIPALIDAPVHLTAALMGFTSYLGFIYVICSPELRLPFLPKIRKGLNEVTTYSLLLLGLWLIMAISSSNLVKPRIPYKLVSTFRPPRGIYTVVQKVDKVQAKLLSSPVLREVRGVRDKVKITLD